MGIRIHPNPCLPIAVRLWRNVAKAGPKDCWPWQAHRKQNGYGAIRAPGKKGKLLFAHRVAYEDVKGPIPAGLNVLHKCDNPPCCNPEHLWVGSHTDNMADKIRKGRARYAVRKGEKNPSAKLTPTQVLKIRSAPGSYQKIAQRYGITASNVAAIKKRKSWAHLPESNGDLK